MVVGNGDIAAVLPNRADLVFFASGVSNSQCTDEREYTREINLLLDQPRDAHIVYFSSLGVLDGTSRYYHHKRYMELLVKETFAVHTIVRIGNISWGKNPHTLLNYLKTHHQAVLQDVYRHVVSQEEFCYWIDRIPLWSCELNIPGERLKVIEIANKIKEGTL